VVCETTVGWHIFHSLLKISRETSSRITQLYKTLKLITGEKTDFLHEIAHNCRNCVQLFTIIVGLVSTMLKAIKETNRNGYFKPN